MIENKCVLNSSSTSCNSWPVIARLVSPDEHVHVPPTMSTIVIVACHHLMLTLCCSLDLILPSHIDNHKTDAEQSGSVLFMSGC